MVKNKINQKLHDNLGNGNLYTMAKSAFDGVFAQWDLDMHLKEVTTQNGENAFICMQQCHLCNLL